MLNTSSLEIGAEAYPGYSLRQFMGQGACSFSWSAETIFGTNVALQFIPNPDRISMADEIRMIHFMRHLQHPHLVGIDQVWNNQDYIVIAMELAEGSLLDLLSVYMSELNTPIVPEQVCMYLGKIADALDFLNTPQHLLVGKKVGIQHCDVRPGNMLLFGEVVKLGGFGLASVTTAPIKEHRRAGKMDYTSPEVIHGKPHERSDQFGLAVTYCQLRSGHLPFPEAPTTFDSQYVRPAPDLSFLLEEEQPIVSRALSANPEERWPSCKEMVLRLGELFH